MRKRLLHFVLLASLLVPLGCTAVLIGSGVAVGAAAVGWQRGWLKATLDEPMERVQRAARSALVVFKVAADTETTVPIRCNAPSRCPTAARFS